MQRRLVDNPQDILTKIMEKLLNNLEKGVREFVSIHRLRIHKGLGIIPVCTNRREAGHQSITGYQTNTYKLPNSIFHLS